MGTRLALEQHLQELKACTRCPNMVGPVVTHGPVLSKVFLLGQAPGPKEGSFGRPFAWMAGKTLFKWLATIGLNEDQFRSLAYMSAVCRCFPGKTKAGTDRVPTPIEVENCSAWIKAEFELLKPALVIPVGRLAIEQVLERAPLVETIGQEFKTTLYDHNCDVIPLPHPSGASTWFKKEPGQSLLYQALALIDKHPAWRQLKGQSS